MDFRLEHDLNRHAGSHPVLDWIARHIAESQWIATYSQSATHFGSLASVEAGSPPQSPRWTESTKHAF